MTDKEIINALEYVRHYLPLGKLRAVIEGAYELCNRQQAEIERLTDRNKRLGEGVGWLLNNENGIELIRAEAIKEFAQKLKDMSDVWEDDEFYFKYVTTEGIDNLVKEMVGR